jgi:hydrogenase maturation protease
MSVNVLVAGIGNVLRSDDGFGVEVARQLAAEALPPGVSVADFGIRALHLSYALLDPPRLLLVVDTYSRGEAPGTLFVVEPSELAEPDAAPQVGDGHELSLTGVLRSLRALGGEPPPVRLIGCEPACLDEGMGLSAPVALAVPRAVGLVRREIERELVARPGAQEESTS